jgi:hypothetical protein
MRPQKKHWMLFALNMDQNRSMSAESELHKMGGCCRMLTRIIPDPANLSALDKRDIAVHISRRPKTTHIIEILATCPRLKRISISPSTDVHLSESIRKLLAWAGIELVVTNAAWGKRHELVDGLVEI